MHANVHGHAENIPTPSRADCNLPGLSPTAVQPGKDPSASNAWCDGAIRPDVFLRQSSRSPLRSCEGEFGQGARKVTSIVKTNVGSEKLLRRLCASIVVYVAQASACVG